MRTERSVKESLLVLETQRSLLPLSFARGVHKSAGHAPNPSSPLCLGNDLSLSFSLFFIVFFTWTYFIHLSPLKYKV